MDCSTPGFPVHHQLLELLKLMSIKSVADYKPGKETSPETIPVNTSISDFQPPEKLRK